MNGLSIAPIANLIHRVPPFQSRHILASYPGLLPCSLGTRLDTYMISLLFVQLLVPINICILFSPIQFPLWNNLPDSVVHSNSLVTFKTLPTIVSLYLGCMLALAVRYFMHPLLLCINFIEKKTKLDLAFQNIIVNVMGEYFANEIVQSCGKGYETEVTKMG